MIRWTGIPLINRITRILHAKRTYLSANDVTRDEQCHSDANETRAVPVKREAAAAPAMIADLPPRLELFTIMELSCRAR